MLKSKRQRRKRAIEARAALYVSIAILGGVPTDASPRVIARARRVGPNDIDKIVAKNLWRETWPDAADWASKLRNNLKESFADFDARVIGAAHSMKSFGSKLSDIVVKLHPTKPLDFTGITLDRKDRDPIQGRSVEYIIVDDVMKDPPNGENP